MLSCFLPVLAEAAPGTFWLWQFLGRLHPMMVHFPVALLVVVLFVELFTPKSKKVQWRPAIRLMLRIGAATAVLSVVFGLLLQAGESYSGDLVVWHQWTGIATAFLSVVVVLLERRMPATGAGRGLYRAALVVTVLGVSVAGHLGASLTHGAGFLTEVLPWHAASPEGIARNPDFDIAQIRHQPGTLQPQQVADLNLEVRAIFAHNCYKCHGAEKVKGELRLDKKEFVFRGGESGPVLSPGAADESELVRRILLPRGHDDAMPPKGKGLGESEIETLRFWINQGAPWPDSLAERSVFRVAALEPRKPDLPPAEAQLHHPIDRLVDNYFSKHNVAWRDVVDDRLFLRRVYLDLIGLLPTPSEIDAFRADPAPDRRERFVKHLLTRNDDYAQHWLTFWNDALRNDYTGTGYITGGRKAITQWLYESLWSNKPYDVFARELISPTPSSEGFIGGIRWRGTVNASQRTEMQAAQNVSQVFLGLNLKCASCHNSFVSDWKLEDAYAFANIFAGEPLEINRCDKPTGRLAGTRIIFEDLGVIDSTAAVEEKRRQLAEYLTAPRNGRFYRTIVNRIWAQMMGRGMIASVDEMDDLPWDQDLLDWLAWDFEKNGSDLRRLMYLIATSRTYQQPSVELAEESALASDDFVFRGMVRRRLSAEQFADAVSAIVHPVYPDTLKAHKPIAQLPMRQAPRFVRASLVKNDAFQTALGRPNRENVSTARASQASLLQALELTNGEALSRTLREGAVRWRAQYPDGEDLVRAVYARALGRAPQQAELQAALNVLGDRPGAAHIEDFLWSILLLPEFQLIY